MNDFLLSFFFWSFVYKFWKMLKNDFIFDLFFIILSFMNGWSLKKIKCLKKSKQWIFDKNSRQIPNFPFSSFFLIQLVVLWIKPKNQRKRWGKGIIIVMGKNKCQKNEKNMSWLNHELYKLNIMSGFPTKPSSILETKLCLSQVFKALMNKNWILFIYSLSYFFYFFKFILR